MVGAEDVAPFRIDDIWRSSKTDGVCKPYPTWTDGVQHIYDDVIDAFAKFPPGPLLDDAKTLITIFQNLISNLVKSSNSNSTILSSGAAAILGVVGEIKPLVNTPIGFIREFDRVLPNLMETYRDVISNLSTILGDSTNCVNNAMIDLEHSFNDYMTKFLQTDSNVDREKLDYSTVTNQFDALNSTISTVAQDTNDQCEPATPQVQDAVAVMNLVLGHVKCCCYGLSSCSAAVLYEQKGGA